MAKEIGSESHVYNKAGELEGLYLIDGKAARQAFGDSKFWEGVEEVVRLYTQINPGEIQAAIIENTNIRFENNNKFGSDSAGVFRQALNLPYGLHLALTDYEPTLFRNKKTRQAFMKRYPKLRSCETV